MENEGQIMTNAEFDFPIGGKIYKVRRASLRQVMDWQRKVSSITKESDAAGDLRMVSYAIYLTLRVTDANITEDWVLDNVAGDIDVTETLSLLGFMSQQKVAMMGKLKNSLVNP